MSDRFKFRAWDKIAKIMIPDVMVLRRFAVMIFSTDYWAVFENNDEGDFLRHWEPEEDTVSTAQSNVKIMQSTGLKDKNGVLIFEGDCFYKPLYGASETPQIVYVEWVSDMWHLKSTKYKNLSDGNYRLDFYVDRLEIIGNIHENPELLK